MEIDADAVADADTISADADAACDPAVAEADSEAEIAETTGASSA
jgi:hypothetical protein